MKNSREKAFWILYDILSNNAYSNIAIDKALKDCDKEDKAFITHLVYGVIERKITLEYYISQYLSGKTKPKIKILLYLGAYQLLFMESVPDYAVVNETVDLAAELGLGYYKGLLNAVLRKISNSDIKLENIDDYEIRYSCPAPLINKWTKAYGKENALSILESINERPPVFAIPNRKYVDQYELQYELADEGIDSEIYNDVVVINSSFNLHNSRSFKNGLFYIEDYSSYCCANALEAKENDIVLDMCSAPGGKAFTIAQSMNEKGSIIAFDIHEHRLKLVEESAQRLGIDIIKTSVNDATVYNPQIPLADKILCDVVCSGFGIIRRKQEIRYKNLDDLKELPEIQYNILTVSSKYLKNGGRLVYSTCTLNKQENEKVVEKFLAENDDYYLLEMKTIMPDKNSGDGFFWAVLERNDRY